MTTGAKLGIHSLTSGIPALSTMLGAGVWPKVCKAVDNIDWLIDVRRLSPVTLTMARFEIDGNIGEGVNGIENATDLSPFVDLLFAPIAAKLAARPELRAAVDYWEICNEPAPPVDNPASYRNLGRLMIACMARADLMGIKLGLLALNAGTPEWHNYQQIVESGMFGVAKSGGHVLTIHEGVFRDGAAWQPVDHWWPGTIPGGPAVDGAGPLCFRYRFLYHLLKQRGEVVPLVVSEFRGGEPDYAGRLAWYEAELAKDWYTVAVLPFSWGLYQGGESWGDAAVEPHMPGIVAYMQSVKGRPNTPYNPPAPPPVAPPAQVVHPVAAPGNIGKWEIDHALPKFFTQSGVEATSEPWSENGYQYMRAWHDGRHRVAGWLSGDWRDAFWTDAQPPAPPSHAIVDVIGKLPTNPRVAPYSNRTLDRIKWLTIHHTAAAPEVGALAIANYHANNLNWPGIGYHYLIAANGLIEQCQALTTISYHDAANTTSVGISLRGRFMDGDEPTAAQIDATRWLIAEIERQVGRPIPIRGHKDVPGAATSCPGDTWHEWRALLTDTAPEPPPVVPPAPGAIDLWEFMTGGVTGWGAAYMVEVLDANGNRAGMERYQNYVDGNRLYITKGDLVEVYELRGDTIWQIIDTSPGNMDAGEPTYYTVAGGSGYAPRWLTPGMAWEEADPHVVTFRRIRDCVNYGSRYSGAAVNRILNVTLDGDTLYVTGRSETQIWQRGKGRVGWLSEWGSARLSTDDPGNYLNLIVLPPCSGVTV